MRRALFHAERGLGRTSPNPIVGAVVMTPDGVVVGHGAHLAAGTPHAEIHALEAAGDRARGGTMYCTLEPCSHTGRTGPCVERIVDAGIARVVIGARDCNPRVNGRGVAYLRDRGVAVVEGVEAQSAERQLAPFFTWVTDARPFVVAKVALSADGFVGRVGERSALTAARANQYFHQQRTAVDAIAVGAGTMLVDDPLLTARGAWRDRPLMRLIFDWRGRVGPSARVFSTLAAGPVIMVVLASALTRSHDAIARHGGDIWTMPDRALPPVLARLGKEGIVTLLAEGGPALHGALLDAQLIDRVQVVTTPAWLGTGVPAPWVERARGGVVRGISLGPDRLQEFDVHRPD